MIRKREDTSDFLLYKIWMLKFWIITIQIFLKKTILSNEIVRIEDTAPKIVFFLYMVRNQISK